MTQNQKKSNKQRRLAAIMFTDMVGYSSLTQKNESLAIELLEEHRLLLRKIFPIHGGTEVETVGDAFFVEFKSALEAVNCAIEIQRMLFKRNSNKDPQNKIHLRIGLHVGDVIQIGKHVHGDGVNIAARLEPLSSPGGICLSEDVARQIQNKIDFPIEKISVEKLKNIQSPMNIYHLILPWQEKGVSKSKSSIKKFALHRYIIILTILVILIITSLFVRNIVTDNAVDLSSNRIAVLPLLNISEDSDNEYFADGMTEELISQLTKISGLNVIARTSVMKYKDTRQDVEEIGKDLNVGTILGGSVRKSGQKARIVVRLVDVNTQEHLWSAEYDRELKDIFVIQTDIALKVAGELRIKLIPEDRHQIEKMGTHDLEAYRLYLRGRFHFNKRNKESLFKSLENFQKATELDPDYALAYVGIADCYTLMGGGGYGSIPQDLVIKKAKNAVSKALKFDNTLAEAYSALAYINFRLEWNWLEAEKNFRKAIDIKPGYAPVYEKYAFFLALLRRFDEAIPLMHHAHNLNPLSASVITGLGRIYHFARDHDMAIQQFNAVLEMDPDYVEALFGLGLAYDQKKMYDEAIRHLKRAIELSDSRPIIVAALGQIFARTGKREEAVKLLNSLKKRHIQEGVSDFYQAIVDVSLGNIDSNMDIIHRAYDEHFGLLVYIKVEPLLDPFRAEAWYQQLIKKMNL